MTETESETYLRVRVQCPVHSCGDYQLQYCEQDQLLCVVLEDEARLDQFSRPVVAQQNPRMMPSEEWPWPAPAVTLHIVKGDSRQEQEDRSAPAPYTNERP